MTDRRIERSDGRCFGWQQLLANFHIEKTKWLVVAQNLQSIKTLLTLELSQYCKSGSMFSSSEPVASSSDWSRLGNALCLCSPIMIRPAVLESGSKSLAVSLNLRLHSVTAFGEIARWQAGAQTWTQTWTLLPDQQVAKVFKFIAKPYFAWLRFGISNWLKKNSNSTQFMLWFWTNAHAPDSLTYEISVQCRSFDL